MITYFTGSTFNQILQSSIEDLGELVYEPKIEEDQDFSKYIKQNLIGLSGIDCLILDVSVCLNTDEELLAALEMVRTMYDDIRLIVFAPYRQTGDLFLTNCLAMGITNIINTDDFCAIQDELKYCIQTGKTYRDAVKYKESRPEKITVRHKRTVNRRLIGIAGTEQNIGVTHSAIVLGNFFRRKGFMVALAERNDSGAFDAICTDFGEHCFAEGYYTLNGVDFYPGTEEEETDAVQQRPYNVIILDFGAYGPQNKDAFERCEDRIIIAGSKSWELDATNRIFANASADVLEKYIFVFNHTKQEDYDAIRKGMGRLEQVHFLPYAEDPLMSAAFPDGDAIFADILPEEPEQEAAKGFLSKLRKGKERR